MKRETKTLAVIDCETDPFKHGRLPKPFLWNYYNGEIHQTFTGEHCTKKLAHYLANHCDNELIYAHNGGKFDVHFLLDYLNEDIKIINGRVAVCSIGTNEIRDSMLIFPQALSAYDKDEIDYSKFEEDCRDDYMPEIIDYCRADCRYLYEIVSAFRDRFGDKLTAAGTAYNELKKSGYKTVTSGEHYDNQFRPFYFGGRVQPFTLGRVEGPLKYFDINSAYPFAMTFSHPSSIVTSTHLKLPDKAGGWFAEIDAVSRGALPLRETEPIKRLRFYSDNKIRTYKATGWEIIAGLETGTLDIKKVRRVIKHNAYCSMADYILPLYNERKAVKKKIKSGALNANELSQAKLDELFIKLLMNSAYGKFAQDSREFKDYLLLDVGNERNGYEWLSDHGDKAMFERHVICQCEHKIVVGGLCKSCNRPLFGRFNNTATGASITGFVRAYLWRAICTAKNPIYCDTDSLICESFSERVGGGLGDWKLEADIKTAWIGGRKNYVCETTDGIYKQATKGFRVDCIEHAKSIENNQKIVWKNDAPSFSARFGPRFVEREINHEKSL